MSINHGGFNFTIAISPSKTNLDREMEYIKSALLYADTITLISPMAYLYFQLTDESYLQSEKSAVRLINKVFPFCKIADPVLCRQYEPILKEFQKIIFSKKYKNVPMIQKLEIKKSLKDFAGDINNVFIEMIGETICQDISQLIKQGKVKLQKFNHSIDDTDMYVEEFFKKLKTSASSSFPLFDEQSNGLIKAAIKSGIVDLSSSDLYKATHAGLADDVLTRLPSFEYASIDEIIDIRDELKNPLVRFRSKILEYTDNIQSLPWDKDFERECHILYHKEITPALLEIDELTNDANFIKNLGRNIFTDNSLWQTAGSMIVSIAAVGVLDSFSDAIASDTAILTTGGVVAASKIANTYNNYKEKKKDINRKDLYFYYKTGKMLRK